jgi:hypothetical protein
MEQPPGASPSAPVILDVGEGAVHGKEALTMSPSSSNSALIRRGRKAGLTTRELYSALNGRPSPRQPGRPDDNGFVAGINPQGRRVYRPVGSPPRP